MGNFERTNHPSIRKYVGTKGVSFIIKYQSNKEIHTETFSSIREAMRVLQDRREKAGNGEIEGYLRKKKTTFRELAERYVSIQQQNDYYKKSKKYCLFYIPAKSKDGEIKERPLVQYFNNMRLIDITPEQIEKYKWHRKESPKEWVKRKAERIRQGALRERRELTQEEVKEIENLPKGVSNATVSNELGFLRHMLNKAVEWNLLDRNPFEKFKQSILLKKNRRERFLTEDELNRVFSNSPKPLQDIVAIAVYTGLRKSDILSLKWSDFKLGEKMFFYVEKKKGGKQGVKFMNDDLIEILMGIPRGKSEYLFPGEKGGYQKDFGKTWRRALRVSGIKDFKFHDLRHTSESHFAMRGVSLQAGQKHLGHSSPAMTERYTHLSEQFVRSEIQKLNGLIQIKRYKNGSKFEIGQSGIEIQSDATA
jgi:integrase